MLSSAWVIESTFYRRIQNKMHYAVHQHTAAELIVERADAEKEHISGSTVLVRL